MTSRSCRKAMNVLTRDLQRQNERTQNERTVSSTRTKGEQSTKFAESKGTPQERQVDEGNQKDNTAKRNYK